MFYILREILKDKKKCPKNIFNWNITEIVNLKSMAFDKGWADLTKMLNVM